ncbi:MAG: hypothetical protein Q9191_001480 [Dirinaria sp. TL-2023a]
MSSKEYQLISDDNPSDDDSNSLAAYHYRTTGRHSLLAGTCLLILFLSLSANGLWIILHITRTTDKACHSKTAYAGLERNVPVAFNDDSDFASHNRSIWDEAWKSINPDAGLVAISDDMVAKTGIPEAQRWPWDSSKGLYLLQSHHNLHCLIIIRTALTEMHDKVPQTMHFTHVNHCLDAIRQDIMCNADDTPRYTGFLPKNPKVPSSGLGQVRMCRDWKKLERWAEEHSACYRYRPVETLEDGIPLESFKHCPNGRNPGERLGAD